MSIKYLSFKVCHCHNTSKTNSRKQISPVRNKHELLGVWIDCFLPPFFSFQFSTPYICLLLAKQYLRRFLLIVESCTQQIMSGNVIVNRSNIKYCLFNSSTSISQKKWDMYICRWAFMSSRYSSTLLLFKVFEL